MNRWRLRSCRSSGSRVRRDQPSAALVPCGCESVILKYTASLSRTMVNSRLAAGPARTQQCPCLRHCFDIPSSCLSRFRRNFAKFTTEKKENGVLSPICRVRTVINQFRVACARLQRQVINKINI